MSFKKSSTRPALLFGVGMDDLKDEELTSDRPFIELPVHSALSPYEEKAAKQAIALQKLVYNGLFFTGLNTEDSESAAPPIERYSDRYKQVKKVGISIDEYPYQLDFFPKELYPVMGISKKKKQLLMSSFKADGGLALYNFHALEETVDVLDKVKALADQLDVNGEEEFEEAAEDDDIDDQFELDDDNDYNAEQYFENGDEDMAEPLEDEAVF